MAASNEFDSSIFILKLTNTFSVFEPKSELQFFTTKTDAGLECRLNQVWNDGRRCNNSRFLTAIQKHNKHVIPDLIWDP